MVALLLPQRFVGRRGMLAQAIFDMADQHRPIPPWLPITSLNRRQQSSHGGFKLVSSRSRAENIERNGIAAMVKAYLVDDDPPNGHRSGRGDGRAGGDFR